MRMPSLITSRLTTSRRGVLAILGGTAGGQAVAFIVAPLLSRLYSPTDFGLFATVSALIVTLGTVSALRIELAIPLPHDDSDAFSLATLGLAASAFVACAGTVAVSICGWRIADAFDQPGLMPWLWTVPVFAATMGCFLVLNQLAIRQRRFGSIGRRNFAQSLVMVLAQTGGGLAGLRPGGLILGLGLGQAVGAFSLTFGAGLASREAKSGRRQESLRRVAHRYRHFPYFMGPSGLLNVLGLQLPVLLIAYWYGSEVAGWLGLTQRVLALPVTLIGTAVAQVYLSEIARAVRSDWQWAARLFTRTSKILAGFALALLVLLLTLGPWAFSVVFGQQWSTSGRYAQALAIGLAGQLVAAPLSQTLIALERQRTQLAWDASRVLLTFVGVAAAVHLRASPLVAIWIVSLVSAGMYAASWALSYRSLSRAVRSAPPIQSHR